MGTSELEARKRAVDVGMAFRWFSTVKSMFFVFFLGGSRAFLYRKKTLW